MQETKCDRKERKSRRKERKTLRNTENPREIGGSRENQGRNRKKAFQKEGIEKFLELEKKQKRKPKKSKGSKSGEMKTIKKLNHKPKTREQKKEGGKERIPSVIKY